MSDAYDPYHNGSLWFDGLDAIPQPLPAELPERVDVAIVGGGYTGLWTAYYLKRAEPTLDVAVFESDVAGFGASGRNGGWCIGAAWGTERLLADPATRSRGLALMRSLFDTVDEVGRVCQAENIDCHYVRGGTLRVATAAFQADRQRRELERLQALGFGDADFRWLDADAARGRINLSSNHGALHFAHCAAIQPARLVRGLADTVRGLGVRVLEATPVTRIEPGHLETLRGRVRAGRILRATEAYTASLRGERRTLLPVYSMMVATAPLPDSAWDDIGLAGRETFGDDRRLVIYGQRTLDNRLALGGRAGYRFGSERRRTVSADDGAVQRVATLLRELLPQLADHPITHGWGGVLGVPRHWRPCVTFDPRSGLGWAGGYVGEGVAASNLAARTLTDLVLERTSALTDLPWVDDVPRRWEPEPLRWLGAKAIQAIGQRADREELEHDRPSRFWGGLFEKIAR
ncbi:MAG: FAD-dependent oxidoreductase [Pseudomonadales bacterium]